MGDGPQQPEGPGEESPDDLPESEADLADSDEVRNDLFGDVKGALRS